MKKSKKFIKLCKKYGVNPDNVKEILSYKDACKDLSRNPNARPDNSKAPKKHREYLDAHFELITIAEALGAGEGLNYTDGSSKYNAYFGVKADAKRPSGFAFSYSYYVCWATRTDVGSRLSFSQQHRDTTIFFARHFTKLHFKTQFQ